MSDADGRGALAVRDAVRPDAAALARLYAAAGIGEADVDAASVRSAWDALEAALPAARVLVAERDGEVVGSLTFCVVPSLSHPRQPAALVESVAVLPQARRQGVGRVLMNEALRLAGEAGCYKMALSSNARREEAHRFYRALGYSAHGVSFAVTLDTGGAMATD